MVCLSLTIAIAIPGIAQFFLAKFNRERNRHLKFSKKSVLMLESYDFPGNVRELRNIIEDAFVFTEGHYIQPDKLSFHKSLYLKYSYKL